MTLLSTRKLLASSAAAALGGSTSQARADMPASGRTSAKHDGHGMERVDAFASRRT